MKPLGHKNYGSIPHLSISKLGTGDHFIHEGQERILTLKTRDKHDEVLVFEKYDGSNIGVAKVDNKILALTRSGYTANTSKYKQHHYFSDWVYKNIMLFHEMLKNDERITGEWMAQAHGLEYDIKKEPVIFFDYFDNKNKRKEYDYLKNYCGVNFGLQTPRLLHRGNSIKTSELLDTLNLKTNDIKSKELPEGMVFRVERNNKVDFLAKWVRSDFKTGRFMDNEPLIWNWLP
jgi:ATP-dependent RNA circularization protein (DNA/RNA ligase family)